MLLPETGLGYSPNPVSYPQQFPPQQPGARDYQGDDHVKGLLEMDALGHVYTDIHMRTSVPGAYAYACADPARQLGAALGDGITAALAACHDLQE